MDSQTVILELYIAGGSEPSQRARRSLRRLCRERLGGACRIEVVDVLEHPQRAAARHVIVTPTLMKVAPLPIRRVIGDLNEFDIVLSGLGLSLFQDQETPDQGPGGPPL